MNNQVKLLDVLESFLHDVREGESDIEEITNVFGYNEFMELLELVKKSTPPVPTIKLGDKVRHISIGTTGEVAETSDIGAYVHWSTGQRSWYPFSYLEVVE